MAQNDEHPMDQSSAPMPDGEQAQQEPGRSEEPAPEPEPAPDDTASQDTTSEQAPEPDTETQNSSAPEAPSADEGIDLTRETEFKEPELLGRPASRGGGSGVPSDFMPQSAGGGGSDMGPKLDQMIEILHQIREGQQSQGGQKEEPKPDEQDGSTGDGEPPATLAEPGPSHRGPPGEQPEGPPQLGPAGPSHPGPSSADGGEASPGAPSPDTEPSDDGGGGENSMAQAVRELQEMKEHLQSIDHALNSDRGGGEDGVKLGSGG